MRIGIPDLVVDSLSVRFGGLVAVDDVSIRCRAGQITGLVGPNGAGKTTIFNACTGMIRPKSGHIVLGNSCLDGCATSHTRQQGTR